MPQSCGAVEAVEPVVTRTFVGRRAETEDAISRLSEESQAGLRQYSIDRMLGYGVDYADAMELRGRILEGEVWSEAALSLADMALMRVEQAPAEAGRATQLAYLRRASALLRIGQTLMLNDTPERIAIFVRAADLYARAAELAGDRRRVQIDTPCGKLAGWLLSGGEAAVASAIVIGGVEGWAMDFDSLGEALAARGIDTLLLDGPGQGESRFAHRTFVSAQWRDAYTGAIDFLDRLAPDRPIGFVGNSMGGSFAMSVAAGDCRIRACCNNGGPIAPGMIPPQGTFFSKMMAMCNVPEPREATEIWSSVTPAETGPNAGYPLLMVQGGEDPMVSTPLSQMLFERAPTGDKQMVIFSDGDHCIYRHRQDRDVLIADWLRARLCGPPRPEMPR